MFSSELFWIISILCFRLSENNKPFEARIFIPQLKIFSRYESSGMLFILPASGNGTFNGQLGKNKAILKTQLFEYIFCGIFYYFIIYYDGKLLNIFNNILKTLNSEGITNDFVLSFRWFRY